MLFQMKMEVSIPGLSCIYIYIYNFKFAQMMFWNATWEMQIDRFFQGKFTSCDLCISSESCSDMNLILASISRYWSPTAGVNGLHAISRLWFAQDVTVNTQPFRFICLMAGELNCKRCFGRNLGFPKKCKCCFGRNLVFLKQYKCCFWRNLAFLKKC